MIICVITELYSHVVNALGNMILGFCKSLPCANAQAPVLQLWTRTSDSDLLIAEALQGSALSPMKPLSEIIESAVEHQGQSKIFLKRSVCLDTAQQIGHTVGLAVAPSAAMKHMAQSVEANIMQVRMQGQASSVQHNVEKKCREQVGKIINV